MSLYHLQHCLGIYATLLSYLKSPNRVNQRGEVDPHYSL